MFRTIVILMVCISAASAGPAEDNALQRTLDTMQGNWDATSAKESGIEAGPQRLSQMSMRFDAGVLSLNSTPEEAVRITIDVTSKPMRVEWLDRHGWAAQGVIQVNNGRIDICYVPVEFNGRGTGLRTPADFDSTVENRATRITFERKAIRGRR